MVKEYVYRIIWDKEHEARKVAALKMVATDYAALYQTRRTEPNFKWYYPMHYFSPDDQAFIREYMCKQEEMTERLMCRA